MGLITRSDNNQSYDNAEWLKAFSKHCASFLPMPNLLWGWNLVRYFIIFIRIQSPDFHKTRDSDCNLRLDELLNVLWQWSSTPGPQTGSSPRPVRNQATQQEVSSRWASEASSSTPHRSHYCLNPLLHTPYVEKLSSMQLVPCAKRVGDSCSRGLKITDNLISHKCPMELGRSPFSLPYNLIEFRNTCLGGDTGSYWAP